MFVSMSTIIYGANFNYNLDYSELPYNDSIDVIVNGQNNLTLYVEYGNFTSGDDTLNFTSSSAVLKINVYIPEVEPLNYTDKIVLYNDDINFTYDLTFAYYIRNDTPTPDVDYMQIDFNEFEYSICDYDLPWNSSKLLTINGVKGQEVYTLFNEDFFDVPDSFTIGDENYSIINISMHLHNLSRGSYTELIIFSVVDGANNVTFHFEIQDCIRPPPEYEEMIEVCSIINKTAAEALNCQRLQTEYNLALYDAMLEVQQVRVEQNTTIEYRNQTLRIPVLDLYDEAVVTAIKEIPRTWNQMIAEQREKEKKLSAKEDEIKQLITEKEQLQKDINSKVEQAVVSMSDENKIKQNTIDMYEEKYLKKSTIIWFVVMFLVIGGIAYGYHSYTINNPW